MDLTHSADNRQDNFLRDINNLMLCVAHVRFLLDRYIAANQGQENSLLGNDYDLKAIANAFASCRAVDPICQTFGLSLFGTTILLSCVGQAKSLRHKHGTRPPKKATPIKQRACLTGELPLTAHQNSDRIPSSIWYFA